MHNTQTFELKGSLFTLTLLRLKSVDMPTLAQELSATIAKAPTFFANAPVVIDMQPLATLNPSCDFAELANIIKAQNMVPIGVRNGSQDHHQAAVSAGLALLPNIKSQETTDFVEKPAAKTTNTSPVSTDIAETSTHTPTKVITQPIRSGKQIYVKGGDLLVLSSVSHGAEILADGNIHVYGALRGRALAGVQGDTNARIFCQDLDAELISIAGHYKISDEIQKPSAHNQGLTHIFLENEELKLEML